MSGEEEHTLEIYGRDIIPALRLEPPSLGGRRR
jgi:hypothetical protein